VLSQVPKCEAPGPPILSGCAQFSRHLGHPSSVVAPTSPGTWATHYKRAPHSCKLRLLC
jgi:hypothetical protein